MVTKVIYLLPFSLKSILFSANFLCFCILKPRHQEILKPRHLWILKPSHLEMLKPRPQKSWGPGIKKGWSRQILKFPFFDRQFWKLRFEDFDLILWWACSSYKILKKSLLVLWGYFPYHFVYFSPSSLVNFSTKKIKKITSSASKSDGKPAGWARRTCARAQVMANRRDKPADCSDTTINRRSSCWWQIIDQRHKSQRIAIYMALPRTIARPHANRL